MYCVFYEEEIELHVIYILEESVFKIKFVNWVSNTFLWMWMVTPGFCQFTSTVLPYKELHIQ